MRLLIKKLLTGVALGAASGSFAAVDGNAVLERGTTVYRESCATGYCHGVNGSTAGAPRLAARGFDLAHIRRVVTEGVPDTSMPGFGTALSPEDLLAVMTYVAALNDIRDPVFAASGGRGVAAAAQRPPLGAQAERGRALFRDADRGVQRCSTCHEVEGLGIPVAGPLASVPDSGTALRALQTPQVQQISSAGESMPGLLVANTVAGVLFYDLSTVPPVLRSLPAGSALQTGASNWTHAAFMQAYSTEELEAVLAYLREVMPAD